METKEKFNITLSKNRIARELKTLYRETGRSVPEFIKFDFDEIEKIISVQNQPSGRNILSSDIDI